MKRPRDEGVTTYATEEMSNKDDEHASCNVATSVKGLEGVRFSVSVENNVVFDLVEGFGRG